LNLAFTFSPRVEDTARDAVTLDIDGLERLFGPPPALAERIVRLASEAGLRAAIGVASNPDAAVCAARGLGGIAVIPAGQEARLLAALPVSLLFASSADSRQASADLEETLRLWGIRTLGELAALPEAALSARIGQEGPRLQKLARGAGCRPLMAFSPVPGFEHSLELEYPVALLEALVFVLSRLLHELWAGLEARALATDELRLRLTIETEMRSAECGVRSEESLHSAFRIPHSAFQTDERTFRLPFPLRDHRAGLKLMQLELEQRPPKGAVTALWLAAHPVEPRVLQDGLFIPLAPAPDKLEVLLARIANLVGQENVGSAELLDTRRPGAFRMKKFTIGSAFQVPGSRLRPRKVANGLGTWNLEPEAFAVRSATTLLAFRAFRPPLAAQVQARQGRPERITARGVKGNVVSLAGAWRTSGDWWKSDGWDRDEWDVALSDGALYRIYCDRATRAWFVEGSYD